MLKRLSIDRELLKHGSTAPFVRLDEEEESSTEEDESNVEDLKLRLGDKVAVPDKVSTAKETEAGAEISALVNYVQPVHFNSFESAESMSVEDRSDLTLNLIRSTVVLYVL